MASPMLIQLAMQLASQGIQLGANEDAALMQLTGQGGMQPGNPNPNTGQGFGGQMAQMPTGQTQYAGAPQGQPQQQPTPQPQPQQAPPPQTPAPAPAPQQEESFLDNLGSIMAVLQTASGANQPIPGAVAPRGGSYSPTDGLIPLLQIALQGSQQQPVSALGSIMSGVGV